MRDLAEENPLEVEASKFGLNYIKLDGNIGCMVNGAGLAMATMDIIKLYGGEPANFLDVGGGASQEAVERLPHPGLRPGVKAVLINIFGGIARTDRSPAAWSRDRGARRRQACRWWCGSRAPTSRRGGASCARRTSIHRRRADGRRRREGGGRGGEGVMAIWVDSDTRLVVQGITGKEGEFHALGCRDYGTKVVAGVTPGKGGETVEGVPVFDSVERRGGHRRQRLDDLRAAAVRRRRHHGGGRRRHRAVVCITEGIPVRDMMRVKAFLRDHPTRLIGPNCPGIITPGRPRSASCRATSTSPAGRRRLAARAR
jgi:succinyl-CoA synthetase alpha subunit